MKKTVIIGLVALVVGGGVFAQAFASSAAKTNRLEDAGATEDSQFG